MGRRDRVDRTRWGRMQASLPPEIVEGLLSACELQYGARAREILSESWSRDLELWDEFVVEMRGLGVLQVHSDACERDDVMECMRACLRAHVRYAAICTKAVVATMICSGSATVWFLVLCHFNCMRTLVWPATPQ